MNLKNIFAILIVFTILLAPAVSGAQQEQKGVHEPGTGLENPELKETAQGTGQGLDGEVAENKQEMNEKQLQLNEEAGLRRSRVANSVQEMEMMATRNGGLGDQIRVIAQNQNRIQEEAEDALEVAQQRKGFARFLIGPNYGQLKDVEERLENHTQNLEELKTLRDQILVPSDKLLLDQQIETMEQIKTELEEAVNEDQKGFSLFGWLNRIIAR